jgi:hypothetical protein
LLSRFIRKRKPGGAGKKSEADHVIPSHAFAEHESGEDGEDEKRDDFLKNLELVAGENSRADTIGGHLKTVFEKSDSPRDQNDHPEAPIMKIFQMAVPGEGHEDVGDKEEKGGSDHGKHSLF